MLYIKDNNGQSAQWHVDASHGPRQVHGAAVRVTELQADGEELDMIKLHFLNIPIIQNQRVVIWTGETAQFIYNNLHPKRAQVKTR